MSYTKSGNKDELAKPILGEDIDGNMDFFVRDTLTNAMATIDTAHLKGHQGKSFYSYYYNAALANGASVNILLTNPALNYPHVVMNILAGGNSTTHLFEGTTTSAAGTAMTSYNRNRSSANTANLVVTHTPTITADGTQIYEDYVAGGVKNKSTGGEDGFSQEIIFLPDTKYMLRVTNVSGAAEVVSIQVQWYES